MSFGKSFRVRAAQGTQYIRDLHAARPPGFRGRPEIAARPCEASCASCRDTCPTSAITLAPVAIDLGRCVFCSECEHVCPAKKIVFTSDPGLGATAREALVVREGDMEQVRVTASATFARLFGRSLRMRQVSAGGCNACELELNALTNVNFDVQRYGIEWVASPRHADALVLTGPLTRTMLDAARLSWAAMPSPRFLVAVGACAISGGLYEGSPAVDRAFVSEVGPALFVPGCPPHPLTFVRAILDFLEID